MKRFPGWVACLGVLAATLAGVVVAHGAEAPSWALLRAAAGEAAERPGVCVVIAPDAGPFCAEIAGSSRLQVFALTPDEAACLATRDALDKAGIGSTRATAMARITKGLPFPPRYANVIVATGTIDAAEAAEIRRVLNPNGVAIIEEGPAATGTAKALTAAGVKDFRRMTAGRAWLVANGAMPEGADDWTCWRHGPEGNPVSSEKEIRPPFRTQWISDYPAVSSGAAFDEMTLVAKGRLVIKEGLGKSSKPGPKEIGLYAKDAFNGVALWEKKIQGLSPSDRDMTLVGDRLYVIAEGKRVMVVDAATGRDVRQYEWSEKDGISGRLMGLFVVGDTGYAQAAGGAAGGASGRGAGASGLRGNILFAFRLADGSILWKHACDSPALGTTVVFGGGAVYYLSAAGGAFAVDLATGKERWRNAEGLKDLAPGAFSVSGNCSMYAPNRAIFWGGRSGKAVALDAATGKVAWESAVAGGRPLFLIGDRLYTYPKHTHEFFAGREYPMHTVDPATGGELETFQAWMPGCGAGTASSSAILSSGAYFNCYDIETKRMSTNSGFFRSNCGEGMIIGNGLVFAPPYRCTCNYAMHGSIALGPEKDPGLPEPALTAASRWTRGPAFDAPLAAAETDEWPCYHHDVRHSADGKTDVRLPLEVGWQRALKGKLTPPVVGGGRVYVGSSDGGVWAMDAQSGEVRWHFRCGAEVFVSPTYWRGRLLVGCDDGRVYCLDAGTGRIAWVFRAAPEDRFLQVAGKFTNTWPVQTGVAVREDGTAFLAAGRSAYDGTYLYSVDVVKGEVKWVQPIGRLNDRGDGVNPDGALALDDEWIYLPTGARPAVFQQADGKLVRLITLLDRKTKMPDGTMANYSNWEWCGGTEVMIAGDMMLYGGTRRIGGSGYDYVVAGTKTGYAYGTREAISAGELTLEKDHLWAEYTLPSSGGLWTPVLCEEGAYAVWGRGVVIALDRQKLAGLPVMRAKTANEMTRWKESGPDGANSLIAAGKAVLVIGDTEVWALSRKDGAKLGSVQLPGKISPRSLAAAGGRAYVVGNSEAEDETVFCLVK